MKKLKLLITTVALSTLVSLTAYAGEWKQDATGWRYQNDDNSYTTSNWFQDTNQKWYFFNSKGYMMTGWLQISNTQKYYYLNNDGSMQVAPITLEGYTYEFDNSGACTNFNGVGMSQDDYKKNMDAINKSEAAKAALYNWRESQMRDTTPGVNLWDENVVSVTDLSK